MDLDALEQYRDVEIELQVAGIGLQLRAIKVLAAEPDQQREVEQLLLNLDAVEVQHQRTAADRRLVISSGRAGRVESEPAARGQLRHQIHTSTRCIRADPHRRAPVRQPGSRLMRSSQATQPLG
jgi:hypothetical protein